METRDPPSLLNRILTPPLLLAGGLSAVLWFFYRAAFLFQNRSASTVLFDKGSYYMLGVGIGLLSLAFVVIKEFWGGEPITGKQNIVLSRLAVSGVILMFTVPHVAHFAADRYLKKNGYAVCGEASHQWLFVRDIVYVTGPIECSADLNSR